MSFDRELLKALAIDEPWSWSSEGLDDCCAFCNSEERRHNNPGFTYVHKADCVWLEAREYLELLQLEHVRTTDNETPAPPQEEGTP